MGDHQRSIERKQMNSEQFISVIKEVVRRSAIKNTIENLEDPPGRQVKESEKDRSDWFNGLPNRDRSMVEGIVADAVDEALFGLLCVIDGVRAIEKSGVTSRLDLVFRGEREVLLNNPDEIFLHDLYNDET